MPIVCLHFGTVNRGGRGLSFRSVKIERNRFGFTYRADKAFAQLCRGGSPCPPEHGRILHKLNGEAQPRRGGCLHPPVKIRTTLRREQVTASPLPFCRFATFSLSGKSSPPYTNLVGARIARPQKSPRITHHICTARFPAADGKNRRRFLCEMLKIADCEKIRGISLRTVI